MYIELSRDGDAAELAPLVGEMDRQEIREATGNSPNTELYLAQGRSVPCWSIRRRADKGIVAKSLIQQLGFYSIRRRSDKGIVAMLGVVPLMPDVGRVWMLASPELTLRPGLFLRHARPFLERIQCRYPLLFNTVAEFQYAHIRWLRWMGFTFIRRWPHYGHAETPFLEFARLQGRREE